MLAVIQRVNTAAVAVDGQTVAATGPGLLILLSVGKNDTPEDARTLAHKIAHLRIFPDQQRRFNLSLLDTKGEALVISQFTLHGDCRKGRRPDFTAAAPPAMAEQLYEGFIAELAALGVPTAKGVFGAMMEVSLVNNGPVTLIVSSPSENER